MAGTLIHTVHTLRRDSEPQKFLHDINGLVKSPVDVTACGVGETRFSKIIR